MQQGVPAGTIHRDECNQKFPKCLLIGATGSLGGAIVEEFRRQQIPFRILGRSWVSFEKAGFTSEKDLDLVVCPNVCDPAEFKKEWFEDVHIVVSVARARYPSTEEERQAFQALMKNLSAATCKYKVPRMLFLGLPYVKELVLGHSTPMMQKYRLVEAELIAQLEKAQESALTIVRIAEFSEAGIIMDTVEKTRIWVSIRGRDPSLNLLVLVTLQQLRLSLQKCC